MQETCEIYSVRSHRRTGGNSGLLSISLLPAESLSKIPNMLQWYLIWEINKSQKHIISEDSRTCNNLSRFCFLM